MAKSMSLQLIYDELLHVSPSFGWNQLLSLIRWQLDHGTEHGYSFGFYAMRIVRASREAHAQQEESKAVLRKKSSAQSLSEIMQTAMNVQG